MNMLNKRVFIKAVLVVFGLLILTRIPVFVSGYIDQLTLVSTLVEFVFFVWGIVLLAKK